MKLAKFVCRLFFVIAAIVAVFSVAFLLADHFEVPDMERDDRAMNVLIISCVVCAFTALASGWIEEKENPIGIADKKVALKYTVEKEAGTRQEFLSLYGIRVYEYFLQEGYIHQLLNAKNERWEVTKHGKLEKQSFE